MLNRSEHAPKFAIDMDKRARFSKFYGIAIGAADLFGDRIICEAGYPKGHVVDARAHAAEFKKAADLVEEFTDPAPCKSGMRVVIRAAVGAPEFRSLWHNGLPGVAAAALRQAQAQVLQAEAEVMPAEPSTRSGRDDRRPPGCCGWSSPMVSC